MGRIVSFDYIRTISIVGIVLCHCCCRIEGLDFLGLFLGNSFNVVFLTLSAFLMGMSWQKRNNVGYGISFVFKRIAKLAYSYYPFIAVMFLFLVCTGYNVTIKDWVMHLLFLPWFDKMPGFGHLWFITMILLCYSGIFLASKLPVRILKETKCGVLLLLGAVASQLLVDRMGLPHYLPVYLLLYLFVFINSEGILLLIGRVTLRSATVAVVTVVTITLLLYNYMLLNKYASVWFGVFSAAAMLLFLLKVLENSKANAVIGYISSISFEIFL